MTTPSQIDLEIVRRLVAEEECVFGANHSGSLAMVERAGRVMPRGVPSSWQASRPHPLYLVEGSGSRVLDVDGNEYVDFHNGYGSMAVGHAHPLLVAAGAARLARGSHFAHPTEESVAVSEHLRDRFGLPLWRFGNSGTEATLDAVRLMRAATGKNIILKVEGTYHGHHDSLMVSVAPPADKVGPLKDPVAVPQTIGLPQEFIALTKVVPFNDLEAVERALHRHRSEVAGMIIEPAMMNAGIVLPEDGYLRDLKQLLHDHSCLLAFDEVKTGATIHYGGATTRFGVTPDVICLAKSIGGGLPCGAIGGTADVMEWISSGRLDQVGTFNGNPLTMTAMLVTLTEILTPAAYGRFSELAEALRFGCAAALDSSALPGYPIVMCARGSVTYRSEVVRNYRDYLEVPGELGYLNWLVQINRGVLLPASGKVENWTISVQHSDDDMQRYVENFEYMTSAVGDGTARSGVASSEGR